MLPRFRRTNSSTGKMSKQPTTTTTLRKNQSMQFFLFLLRQSRSVLRRRCLCFSIILWSGFELMRIHAAKSRRQCCTEKTGPASHKHSAQHPRFGGDEDVVDAEGCSSFEIQTYVSSHTRKPRRCPRSSLRLCLAIGKRTSS